LDAGKAGEVVTRDFPGYFPRFICVQDVLGDFALRVFEVRYLQAPANPAPFVDFSNLAVLAGPAQSQNLEMERAFGPWHLEATCSQGVALGWYKTAPSALKPQNNVDLQGQRPELIPA
jgi:hypothetical protein